MKYILVSVIFMICLSTFSQNTKFSIGIEGSPTYNNILFSTGKENVDNSIKEIFRPKLGFTVGAPINYEITKGLSISSGLYWTNRGHLREEYLEHYPTDWSENPDYVNVNQRQVHFYCCY